MLYRLFPQYFQYPPGTIRNYYNIPDCVPCAVPNLPLTILSLPICTSQSLHLLHPALQPPSSPLATTSLFSVAMSQLLFYLFSYIVLYILHISEIIWYLSLTYFPEHNTLWVHPCCGRWYNFILWYGWVLLHCTNVSQLFYSSAYWWARGLLPYPGYYK